PVTVDILPTPCTPSRQTPRAGDPGAARLDDDLHRVRLRMGCQIQRFHTAFQRETVADKPFQIHFTVHDEPHRFLLQVYRCTVGSQQSLFVHAHRSRINRDLAPYRLGKQQHTTSCTRGVDGRPNQAIPTDCQNHSISSPALRHSTHHLSGVSLGSVNCQFQVEATCYCK